MITLREYGAGEIIFQENTPGETAYLIERGRVEVIKSLQGRDIHLAYLGAGEPFGEMSMIDDKPRSATVRAVEETVVREIHRDHFFHSLQTEPEVAVNLLKVLFERLREADATILQLHKENDPQGHATETTARGSAETTPPIVLLEGLTSHASRALPVNPLRVTKFPFRIGRQSSDPLVHNDLMIVDSVPFQISRHHLALVRQQGRIGVADRGSRLGSLVDGQTVGGPGGSPEPVFFTGSQGVLVLGNQRSPFRYNITII